MMTDATIKKMLGNFQEKIEEARKIYLGLKIIKEQTGASFDLPDFSMDTSESASTGEKGHGREMDIKPDTFFGKSNTESAEKYLKMLGHAAPVDSILEALKKGGAQFKGDGKHTLYVQLIRATSKFVKIGKGPDSTIGLREWYSKIPKPKPDNIPKKKVVIKKVKPKEAKEVKLDSESE